LKEWIVIHKIKALYDEGKGLKIRAIARQLGISRNTVRKYLGMTVEDVHKHLGAANNWMSIVITSSIYWVPFRG
jgi:DNA-binding NarL/FixJ family response regulator